MSKPVLISGGGGHASALVDILLAQGREVLAIVSPEDITDRRVFDGIPHLKNDDDVKRYEVNEVSLVNGIGSLPGDTTRSDIYNRFSKYGYNFETVVAKSAQVSAYSELAEGVQVMSGVIIQTGAKIAKNSIINTGAIIEHDCKVGENCHIAPGAVLCGQVEIQDSVHIGSGSCIIQNIKIGKRAVVAAGASISSDLEDDSIAYSSRPVLKPNHK